MGRGGWGPRPASSHGGSPLVPAGPSQVCMHATQFVAQVMSPFGRSPAAATLALPEPFRDDMHTVAAITALVFICKQLHARAMQNRCQGSKQKPSTSCPQLRSICLASDEAGAGVAAAGPDAAQRGAAGRGCSGGAQPEGGCPVGALQKLPQAAAGVRAAGEALLCKRAGCAWVTSVPAASDKLSCSRLLQLQQALLREDKLLPCASAQNCIQLVSS